MASSTETKEEGEAPVVSVAILPSRLLPSLQKPKETKECSNKVELQPIGDLPSLRTVLKTCRNEVIKMSIDGKQLLKGLHVDGFKSLVLRRVTLESYTVTGLPFPTWVSMNIEDSKGKTRHVLQCPDDERVASNWCTQNDGECFLAMRPSRGIVLFEDAELKHAKTMGLSDKLSLDVKTICKDNTVEEYCNKKDSMGRPVRDDIDFERETVLMNFRLLVDFVAEKP